MYHSMYHLINSLNVFFQTKTMFEIRQKTMSFRHTFFLQD